MTIHQVAQVMILQIVYSVFTAFLWPFVYPILLRQVNQQVLLWTLFEQLFDFRRWELSRSFLD